MGYRRRRRENDLQSRSASWLRREAVLVPVKVVFILAVCIALYLIGTRSLAMLGQQQDDNLRATQACAAKATNGATTVDEKNRVFGECQRERLAQQRSLSAH